MNGRRSVMKVQKSVNDSLYTQNLKKCVIDASVAKDWESAVKEWDIVDCEEDEGCSSVCLCGKENLKYLFTIRNHKNGKILYPIGSTCIEKFERNELEKAVESKIEMYHLAQAIKNSEKIELNSKYFSRNLLDTLYKENVFTGNAYNGYDARMDYWFLLDMFNKRNKENITAAQQRKIAVLISRYIKPYLKEQLKYKHNDTN